MIQLLLMVKVKPMNTHTYVHYENTDLRRGKADEKSVPVNEAVISDNIKTVPVVKGSGQIISYYIHKIHHIETILLFR